MKTNTLPKTWFITGTSSGFGRTLTEKLLARGDCVAATLRSPAPKRLALGSGTHASIRAALVERLAALDSQKDIAFSTDIDA